LSFVVAMPGVALVDGVPFHVALTGALASQGIYWLTFSGAGRSLWMLAKLDAKHQELAVAHQELERLQHAAIQQEKLAGLGLMAAGIAHEINNPMSFVQTNLELLAEDLKALPEMPLLLEEYATSILPATLDGVQRVNRIVADLGGFARGGPEARRSFDLNGEIESALRITESHLKHRCTVIRDLGDLPRFVGHPGQMTQVFVNLFVNAAQAMQEAGTITVTSRKIGEEIKVSVRDTGSGMSAEVQKRLFEPFFTTKPPGEGTGLGLLAIDTIVRRHGGRIEVDSMDGEGSCFTITLPLTPPTQAAVAR
jgi:two-component system, NtrC family, sensor kinase